MKLDENSSVPIFKQIANQLEQAIFTGAYKEEEKIPSTNEIATSFVINPATVLKGMNILVSQDIIYKKRGIGMFVKKGATKIIKKKRNEEFRDKNINEFVSEAKSLDINNDDLLDMVSKAYKEIKEESV